MPMDTDTQKMLGEVKTALGDYGKIKGAVEQLEADVRALPKTFEDKLRAVKSRAWDGLGRYRGVLGSEDRARSFGLLVMQTVGKTWAGEALKNEFPDVSAKAFGSADAGNLIPEEFSGVIVDLIEQFGVFERNTLRVPMSGDIQRYSKKTGRMSAAPMAEGTAIAETKPTLAPKALTARKWGTYIEVPSEVAEDAVAAIGEMIAVDMAEAFALAVDEAGFTGDGSAGFNSITGVVDSLIAEAIVTGTGAAGAKWGSLVLDDFLQVVSLVATRTFQGNNAKWYCSHQFYWTVMVPIVLGVGGVAAGEVEGRRQPLFLGYPVEFTQVLPTAPADASVAAVFGNLRQGAVLGDRRQINIRESRDYKFAEDLIAMLGTRRFDIQVHGAGTGTTPEVLAALRTPAAA